MIVEGLAYLVYQWIFPAFLLFIISTLVLAAFGRSLGIRRIYVKALLKIFQDAGHVSSGQQDERRSDFMFGDEEDSDTDDDANSEIGPSPPMKLSLNNLPNSNGLTSNGLNKCHSTDLDTLLRQSCGQSADSCECRELSEDCVTCGVVIADSSPMRLPRLISRHNVISRKDNLMLSPEVEEVNVYNMHDVTEADHGDIGSVDSGYKEDTVAEKILGGKVVSAATFQRDFDLSDVLDYVKTGVACIIEDEVTQRFEAEELKSWNLLTRTNDRFMFINWKLTFFWGFGCVFRYCFLLPGRIAILIVGLLYMAVGMTLIGPFKEGPFKKWLNHQITTSCFQVLGGAISAVITYHHTENRPKGGICVANHTSPIDVLMLASDTAYALTGQKHGGFLGYLQTQLSKASSQIWFQRGEAKDRAYVFNRLRAHVQDPDKLPILIFPEGTCINNTSIMQFKKGSFEVGGVIYPVAIKYDAKFGDAFWNSTKFGMISYLMMMMTSWAIVCDVWYLPPMHRGKDEDAIEFANRVKKEIALKGGLVDLVWDGNLKRQEVKSEWKAAQQEQFSRRIKVD
eukprot:GFUD01020273.1.p1 GENE.GFUD01020273.1~~GFUD01020273.1.p1  ORF type:complete len:567 (-),score=108.27 GFUD01020273.1:358-2058(-)